MTSSTPDPHRLTPTQRLHEVTLAALNRRGTGPESSVTISRNAKGVAQFEVTARGENIEACERWAITIYERLADMYPYPAVNGGTE